MDNISNSHDVIKGKKTTLLKQGNSKKQKIWILVALFFLLGCIYFLQYTLVTLTNLQHVALQVLEAAILIGIGFLFDSISANLKLRSYAFSAWRRISDVKKTIGRLKAELQRLSTLEESDLTESIRPTNAIVNELEANVFSSEIDWYDVIDDDVENLRNLFNLEQQKNDLMFLAESIEENEDHTKLKMRIENTLAQIEEIRSTLPLSAQEALFPFSEIQIEQISQGAINRLELAMFSVGRISIRISGLPKGISNEDLAKEAPFELWPSTKTKQPWYIVKGKNGIELGTWKKDTHFTEDRKNYEAAVLHFLLDKGLLESINKSGAIKLRGSKLLRVIDGNEFLIAIPKPE